MTTPQAPETTVKRILRSWEVIVVVLLAGRLREVTSVSLPLLAVSVHVPGEPYPFESTLFSTLDRSSPW